MSTPTGCASITAEIGCAIVAANADIAPADRRLYAIRDVTGTVESIDLITASILSKKLAAGLEGLVLDVKVGSGAFMKTPEEAEALARALVATAQGAGCMTSALITDMSQPLATAAGNALEVIEVMETLTGTSVNAALWDLTAALGGELLALGGLAEDAEDGEGRIAAALEGGRAAEMLRRDGGGAGRADGFRRALARPAALGAGGARGGGGPRGYRHRDRRRGAGPRGGRARRRAAEGMATGSTPRSACPRSPGSARRVSPDMPLALVHAATEADADAAEAAVRAAFALGDAQIADPPLIHARIG